MPNPIQFGWLTKPVTISHDELVRSLNSSLRGLWNDFVSGHIVLNDRALVLTDTTTPQLTVRYDGSNYVTLSVSSAGTVTLDATGASAGFMLSDALTVTTTGAIQQSLRYDSSNRLDISVSSTGAVTYDAVGASAQHIFTDLFRVRTTAAIQFQVEYDGSNYLNLAVSSAGAVTFDAVGASAGFTFSDDVNVASGKVYKVNGTQVVSARVTGYAAFTNTVNRGTTYDTATVTLQQLAERVAALQADWTTHGGIGA